MVGGMLDGGGLNLGGQVGWWLDGEGSRKWAQYAGGGGRMVMRLGWYGGEIWWVMQCLWIRE